MPSLNSSSIPAFILTLLLAKGAWAQVDSVSSPKAVSNLMYDLVIAKGVESAISTYRDLKKEKAGEYDLSENQLNLLGYRLLNEDRYEEANSIFRFNTQLFPESINVWDSLAEGFLKSGKRDSAIVYYQKELNMLESVESLTQQQVFLKNNAETNLYIARNFDNYTDATLNFASFYGGVPAGKWDMQHAVKFKEQSGISVSYQGTNLYQSPVPGNLEETVNGKQPADIIAGFIAGDTRRLIEQGLLLDISNLWDQEGWNKTFPAPFKQMATYKGKQYYVPLAYQWNPVWYRKDIFDKHGLTPPKTWKALLQLCDRLNELGYTPFTIGVQSWPPPTARWFTTFNLRLNGPEFHQQVMRGEVPYTDKRIKNVFKHWRELFRLGAFADSSYKNNYQDGIRDITTGKAVMYNLGEWIFESLDEQQGAKLDFFAFPVMNPEVTPAEIVLAYGAYIRAGSSNPENAEEMLKWLAHESSQSGNAKTNDRIVANSNVDSSLYSDVQKRITHYVNDTKVLIPLFEMNTHPEFARKALAIFQEFWKNPEDISAAIAKLEQARQEVFMTTGSSR